MNLFLYIIWSSAYNKRDEILKDIQGTFHVHKIIEMTWSKNRFAENLSRFYGQKLPANSFKEKACGTDPFTLVIFEDKNPVYELRKTSRGEDERVNVHTFDKKMLYRKWTTEGERNIHSRIHGTNSPEETEHDLTLLIGMSPEDFLKRKDSIPNKLKQDIAGADGWKSLEQVFYVMNHTVKYVMLRNFEGLPESFYVGEHADIDLLTDHFENLKRLLKGKPVFSKKYRVQYMVKIAGHPIQFDLRYIGDGYYDERWESAILNHRIKRNKIYIPDDYHYKYMTLYHALVHKIVIADDYINRLDDMFGEDLWNENVLNRFLMKHDYRYVEPKDLSVYFNQQLAKIPVSAMRNFKMKYIGLKKKVRKILGDRS